MGYTVIGENLNAGQTLKEWQTGQFWAKMGMKILLLMVLIISFALFIGSFYADDLFGAFQFPKRAGIEVLSVLVVTLYAEFVYKFVFNKWSYRAGIGTLFTLSIFLLFMLLGAITFVVFLWFIVVGWCSCGLFSIGFFPVLWSIALFFVFFMRRIIEI